ncbi:MAG: Re/Si-specific NAD(P)(+) transhydrogenase subunit alpha [Chloroflexi bacterium]|nr:Re/Si-specific NAD(P)(+) transhydrogenase subunit alpha [Chloroflexota bacterium]
MIIGTLREKAEGETRVALIPDTVAALRKAGHTVFVESGAGCAAGHSDDAYAKTGAEVVATAPEISGRCDIIVKVQRPDSAEAAAIHTGATLVGLLQPLQAPELMARLASGGVTCISMDAIPRIARAQSMDALSSMSTVAGYKAVLMAADTLPRFFPLLMTAAGVVAPARVFIIGAGVAGLQAIGTARRLGAVVRAFDTRPVVKEQVESVGAAFVELALPQEERETAGGYAAALAADVETRERALLAEQVRVSDVVITTALVPGHRAPVLIPRAAVEAMAPGSVIVDLAAESGGNCEVTVPGQVVRHGAVTIIGLTNLPATMPAHASQLYAHNVLSLLQHLLHDGSLSFDFNDEITRATCIVHEGKILNEAVRSLVEECGAATLAGQQIEGDRNEQ